MDTNIKIELHNVCYLLNVLLGIYGCIAIFWIIFLNVDFSAVSFIGLLLLSVCLIVFLIIYNKYPTVITADAGKPVDRHLFFPTVIIRQDDEYEYNVS